MGEIKTEVGKIGSYEVMKRLIIMEMKKDQTSFQHKALIFSAVY